MRHATIDITAEGIERMLDIKTSGGSALFPTPRDVVISHMLAFMPHADCWVGDVRMGTAAELFELDRDAYDPYANYEMSEQEAAALFCSDDEPDNDDSTSEPLPECPVTLNEPLLAPDCPHEMDDCECVQSTVEPPEFWSEFDKEANTQEQEDLEREQASLEWEALHPESRCPPRE